MNFYCHSGRGLDTVLFDGLIATSKSNSASHELQVIGKSLEICSFILPENLAVSQQDTIISLFSPDKRPNINEK